MRIRTSKLLVGLIGVVLLGGCTSTSAGTPRPETDSAPSTSSSDDVPSDDELPADGAPNVPNPLDVTRFIQDPCQALTAAQAQELNVPQTGEPSEGPLGNVCQWVNKETRGSTDLRMHDKYPRGLSATYKADKDGKWAFFEPLSPIEGFPAVAYDISDMRGSGSCAVAIGASNEMSFDVDVQLSLENIDAKEPCETAAMIAGMMLQTMKGER